MRTAAVTDAPILSEGRMPHDDAELLTLAGRGDPSAFARLYNQYERDLYRFAFHLAGEPDTAEELFQDTWLRAVKHMGKTPITNFKSWLFSVAVNLYRDELRRRKVRRFFLGGEPGHMDYDNPESGAAAASAVSPNVDDFMIREGLAKAMNKLSPKQKTIFVLTYIEGFKIREVSELLGKAEGTIKCTLHRALTVLRGELKDFR
jgi:RNA polymerase sigma-70 factor (ECF subfamily)